MNAPVSGARLHPLDRARGVRVLLGPTNTGKTHYAIERMLAHASGMIGLPLRLLAREVYNRVVSKVGPEAVALITGEEKIKPRAPRYWVSTVEAMPRDLDLSFVAIDEIQLAADLDRGHIFTDRLLNRRGREETLLLGASTIEQRVAELLPGAQIIARPRLSKLSFAGDRKISPLPRRSAIVAFSVEDVYAIAEWIRRQRGGAAVVLGALSPRTRNAQIEIYQSGDVDYIVATDAIGMGLNLDVDHIAFAADRKFDGWQYRPLTPAEFGQIAGRAGRHMRDGTFGTTGRCAPFDIELVEALEDHRFEPLSTLQWRNTDLDFSSISGLLASLDALPKERSLTRAPLVEDQMVLDIASRDEKVVRETRTKADVARLWETCQIPDYRKLSPGAHAELVLSVYGFIIRARHIPDDWFARHILELDRVDGDLDTLSARIAQVRTWTFIANRPDWLRDPVHWQNVARQVEDRLSDALHERLAQRFVDRRTTVLMRRLRENAMLDAEITTGGDVMVENQHVGHLSGFRFSPDPQADGEAARALNAAAQKALASEIEGRARRVHEAVDEAFVLANDGVIRWLGEPIGKISAGEHVMKPRATILADEQLTGSSLEMVQHRLDLWLAQQVKKLLGPLTGLEAGDGLDGMVRGIAFRIAEALGVLERAQVTEEVKALPQEARGTLRKLGVRFGAYHLYLPALMKPASRAFAAQLWALRHHGAESLASQADVPHLAASGRTSFVVEKDVPKGFYRVAGFHVCGDRAVRVDILERLADLIRPAIAYRPGMTAGEPPSGAADGDGFVVTVGMTSLAGCSGDSFASILRSLGYVCEQRKGPAITAPLVPKAGTEPIKPVIGGVAEPADDAQIVPDASVEVESPSAAEAPDTANAAASRDDIVATSGPASAATSDPESDAEPRESAEPCAAAADAVDGISNAQRATDDHTAIESANESAGEPVDAEAPYAATTSDDAAATSALQTTTEEQPLIDVWRPFRQRQQRRDQRAPRGNALHRKGGHAAHHAGVRPSAGANGAQSPAGPETIDGAVQLPSGTDGSAFAAARSPDRKEARRQHPGQRKDKRRDWHASEANHKNSGTEKHSDEGRRTSEKSRERLPDPNSPFAKLLVLKQQMESQGRKN